MSSILDQILQSGGQGGSADQSSGALPPDVMSAIQSQSPSDSAPDDSNADPVQALDDALNALQTYMSVEPDEADKAIVATCIANLQKVKAKDQQESDGALQGKVTPRLMRKASAGGSSSGNAGY